MILVLGKNGQMGRALCSLLKDEALAAGSNEINFLDVHFISALDAWIHNRPISAVINAAAYTAVDNAEAKGKQDAWRVNVQAVAELAAWCKKKSLPLIHYSTDYVFDGSGTQPHREEDATNPINAYGASKLAGEQAIIQEAGDYVIMRTSWIYDAYGKNFFNTMLRLMQDKPTLNVVSDQIGAPTYAPHLAAATLKALPLIREAKGIYHVCNAGHTSWHGFACAILDQARLRNLPGISCSHIAPIPTTDYPTPAARPLNSRLDCSRARTMLGIIMPDWQQGLTECFEEKYAI